MASSRHPQAHPHSSAAHILHRNRKRHQRPGAGGGGTSIEGDDEGEGGMGMSSSRDASEEDNDDTSNYSDSASSLRHSLSGKVHPASSGANPLPSTSESSNLPTSARDRALVNSNPAGRKLSGAGTGPGQAIGGAGGVNLNSVGMDKTPSSSSPPKHGLNLNENDEFGSSSASSQSKERRPSNSKDPTAATLQSAAAALASSTTSELQPTTANYNNSPNPTTLSSSRPIARRNLTNSSSAGSGDELIDHDLNLTSSTLPTGSPRTDAGLHLGSLPTMSSTNSNVGGGSSGGVAATPRAQIQPSASATSSSTDQNPLDGDDEDTDKEREESGENGSETDGATYDGDVEFAARTPSFSLLQGGHTPGNGTNNVSHSNAGASGSSAPSEAPSKAYEGAEKRTKSPEPEVQPPSPSEIQKWFQSVLNGTDENGKARDYKINRPVDEGRNEKRPIRIYADGVYDLFHYAHALQLRQAKLSFPHVHLIVGVCSSSSCTSHKNTPVLSSSERYTSVRNCRWVDEVLEDAPWIIDQNLIDTLQVDYVAHDEAPYGGKGSEDIYQFVKDQGKFLPTLRTPGVSTSELLGRIVDQYRHHNFDGKLEKLGMGQLAWKEEGEEVKK